MAHQTPQGASSEWVNDVPVFVDVEFSRTGWQHLPGYVDAAADDRLLVQFPHIGFVHRIWVARDRVTPRQLKHTR